MKIQTIPLFAVAVGALAVQAPLKAIVVSYPKGTPDSIVDQAMNAIKEAGGMVTHEYKLITGFAAKAPAKILESVSAWGADHHVVIEEDQMVQVMSS